MFILLSVLAGVCIGILSGMLGIGGGMLLVPVYKVLYGFSALASTGTSLFTIIFTTISGATSHIRAKTCVPKIGIAMGVGGAFMSPIGVLLANRSPDWLVMLVAALIIGYSGITMLVKAIRGDGKKKNADNQEENADAASVGADAELAVDAEAAGADADAAQAVDAEVQSDDADKKAPEYLEDGSKYQVHAKQVIISMCIGLFAGLMSGYVGVGGGFIMVPLMLSVLGIPMKLASGTSLVAIMILSVPGTIEQGILGNVQYLAGIAVACGSIPGAVIGAKLVKIIPERALRFTACAFMFVSAIALLLE